jgi:hypothetical protein
MSTVSIYREMESSPTVILYGDGGDHEMILRDIDGWYGSPESKVQLSERAYGNGAHDIASEDIDYGARTVMVDWRIIANGRDGMLSALHAIRALAGHTVRVRVVDGMDDLYAVGYVHEASKDKSAQNIPQQTETGTLTIVCQRPEILSWAASESQLMPVSRVRGGLSYGAPAYELAWTGTPNASASTLSQDGQVMATNLITDPNALQRVYVWTSTGSTTAVQQSDGHWVYTPSSDVTLLSVYLPITPVAQDDYVYCAWQGGTGEGWFENMDTVAQGNGWVLSKNTNSNGRNLFWTKLNGTPITILKVGRYSAADYAAMQSSGVTWFSGDSQSPQPNAGLSYGLDGKGLSYGVSTGGERNLAVLSNHGTTVSYPTITVTGPFPNGVEIQTGVGGVIRYTGAVGMVPLVIQCDPRNVAASMGGVDVGRYLTGRDLPAIPAGGSMSLRLMSAGSGWVTVTVRDTYL